MSTDSGRKVRLVKNSFYLYGRSIIQMIVSLITVRLTLKYLGIENYGLYNLLSALVVACSFVNASLVSASNRYITYAIGTGDIRKVSSTFSYSKRIQGILVVVLFFAAELIGILLILFKLSILKSHRNFICISFSLFSVIICLKISFLLLIIKFR